MRSSGIHKIEVDEASQKLFTSMIEKLAGIVFGWLYWRRGLLAAMLAHFSADIVLPVVAPLLNR